MLVKGGPDHGTMKHRAPNSTHRLVTVTDGGSPSSPGTEWKNQVLRVYSDNSATVSYICKQGEPGLGLSSWRLLNCIRSWNSIKSSWFEHNVTTDALAWLILPSPTEWRLHQPALKRQFSAFVTFPIDMIAKAHNMMAPIFVLPYLDQKACTTDTLFISWDDVGLVYTFPPSPKISKTLAKIE